MGRPASRRLGRQRRLVAGRRAAIVRIAASPDIEPLAADDRLGQRERMAAFERLPEAVRAAIRECPFDVHILRHLPSFMDCTGLIAAIGAIKSEREAVAFNQQHMPRGFSRAF